MQIVWRILSILWLLAALYFGGLMLLALLLERVADKALIIDKAAGTKSGPSRSWVDAVLGCALIGSGAVAVWLAFGSATTRTAIIPIVFAVGIASGLYRLYALLRYRLPPG